MSKRKIWSDFNRLECVIKTEKIFAGTWSFNKHVQISSSVERMVLQGGLHLKKMKQMMQTHLKFIIRECAYIFVSTAFYTLKYKQAYAYLG